jgi:hypothetical protein
MEGITELPTLSDVIARLQQSPALTPTRRRDLVSGVLRISEMTGVDPRSTPASMRFMRPLINAVRPAKYNQTPKTWSNLRSNFRAALVQPARQERKPADPEWGKLRVLLPTKNMRVGLSRFIGFCNNEAIAPNAVCDAVADRFCAHLETDTQVPDPYDCHRTACRLWNMAVETVSGWPSFRLKVPERRRPRQSTPITNFPLSLQQEFASYIESLRVTDLFAEAVVDHFLPRAVFIAGDPDRDLTAFQNAIDEWPKPSLPGFWPVPENERAVWPLLCEEEVELYGIDQSLPGARGARDFAYFDVAEGPVRNAAQWLLQNGPSLDAREYKERFSEVLLGQGIPTADQLRLLPRPRTAYFRHVNRRKAKPSDMRTFIPTIAPAGPAHIDSIFSLTFAHDDDLLVFSGSGTSIVFDSICRQTGKEDFRHDVVSLLPMLSGVEGQHIRHRTLRLVSVTNHYAPLWLRNITATLRDDAWAFSDPRLVHEHELPWADLPTVWERGCALRSDFARRQALLEIDVLVAQALNLTLDELQTIYRVQFPVMSQYENADEYDAKGRRLPNTVRKDPGAKELREIRNTHDGTLPLTVSWRVDNGLATVTKTFHPPFTRVDREEDYRRAWAAFIARFDGD